MRTRFHGCAISVRCFAFFLCDRAAYANAVTMKQEAQKAAFVTGGAKRLGRAIALRLAQEGYDIALHYHRSEVEANALAEEIRSLGQQAVLLCQDLRELSALSGLMETAFSHMPHLKVLVNNASTFRRIGFAEMTNESLLEDMAVNYHTPMLLTQAFAREVAVHNTGHANVIHMLDTAIEGNYGAYFAYLLAKKGLRDFTFMAAKELAPTVRVNAICPGFILPSEGEDGENYDPKGKAPLGKAETEDITDAVMQLVIARYLTGQLLYVDAGEHVA